MNQIISQLAPHALRVRRGFERTLAGARDYRFDGERDAHAEQLRETQVSLSLMASASADDPDQSRMASDIEDGAESRLAVLLGKPRLTLEEKRERDAIQAALAERRREFGADPAPHIVPRAQPAPMLGFLGPVGAIAGVRLWMVLAAGWAITGGAVAIQTARLNNAKGDLQESREDLALAIEQRDGWRERAEQYAAAVTTARETAQQTAEALEAERRRVARAAARERRRNAEIAAVLAGGEPPAWSLRDDGSVQE